MDTVLVRQQVRNFSYVATAYLTLVTLHVMVEVYNDCTLYFDVGIYAEAMYKLSWHNPNPWLVSRAVHLFADHFDPVVWLAAPFAKRGPLPYGPVGFEALTMLVGVVPLFVTAAHDRLAQRSALLLAILTLFNAGAVTAVHYPLHPTTWATAPLVALTLAFYAGRYTLTVGAFVMLLACKEEFPFVGLPLAWLLWRAGARRHASWTLALAAVWALFVFGMRPRLMGPTVPYWADPFAGIVAHPWQYVRERVMEPELRERMVLFALPFSPLLLWLALSQKRHISGAWLTLVAPPMALRVLAMRWRHHYHAVTMGGVTMAFVPGLGRREVPRWLVGATVALLLVANYRTVGDVFGLAFAGVEAQYSYCPMNSNRTAALARARTILRSDPGARMIVGQNLLPKLVDLPNARLAAEFDHPPRAPYRWIFMEKPPLGKSWPLGDTRIEALIDRCRAQPSTEVFIDDAGIFLARGTFID